MTLPPFDSPIPGPASNVEPLVGKLARATSARQRRKLWRRIATTLAHERRLMEQIERAVIVARCGRGLTAAILDATSSQREVIEALEDRVMSIAPADDPRVERWRMTQEAQRHEHAESIFDHALSWLRRSGGNK